MIELQSILKASRAGDICILSRDAHSISSTTPQSVATHSLGTPEEYDMVILVNLICILYLFIY